jgi:hypothetical protein
LINIDCRVYQKTDDHSLSFAERVQAPAIVNHAG